jgi:hypothetical protein
MPAERDTRIVRDFGLMRAVSAVGSWRDQTYDKYAVSRLTVHYDRLNNATFNPSW